MTDLRHSVPGLSYSGKCKGYRFILDKYPIPLLSRVVDGVFEIPLEGIPKLLDPKSMSLYASQRKWYDGSSYKSRRLTLCFIAILLERLK